MAFSLCGNDSFRSQRPKHLLELIEGDDGRKQGLCDFAFQTVVAEGNLRVGGQLLIIAGLALANPVGGRLQGQNQNSTPPCTFSLADFWRTGCRKTSSRG